MKHECKNEGANAGQWLREFEGCKHYSDDEAKEIVSSLNILATILLENAAQKLHHNMYSNDTQHNSPKIAA